MISINKSVEVDVDIEIDLDEFSDEDLVEEMQRRNLSLAFHNDVVVELYWAYATKNKLLVEEKLKELFYEELGKIVV